MSLENHVLLHACCAVCFEAVWPALEEEALEGAVFFHNPNIHPYREFEKRLRALEVAAEARKARLFAERDYGLPVYLAEILPSPDRCGACYSVRLGRTARRARELGYGAFTTTLLASGHQRHDEVRAAGEAAGAREGVRFLYRDWRDRMEAGMESARRRSLYRQHYCGCIWSEYERFGPRAGSDRE